MIRLQLLTAFLVGISISTAHAQPTTPRPAAPELGPTSIPKDILRCERRYAYQGKLYPCDSPIRPDGEGLRPILDTVPAAKMELDRYQENRKHRELTGYTGMAGLLIAALAPRFFEQKYEKNTVMTVGLSITLGSFVFGKSLLNENEVHLNRAISIYNEENPKTPITLKGQ